jgi:predicted CopG family antitoxin
MVRVISISDEAYEELYRMKAGRSFTEVIRALVSKRTTTTNFDEVMRFFGSINDKEAASMRKASKEFRRNFVVREMNR